MSIDTLHLKSGRMRNDLRLKVRMRQSNQIHSYIRQQQQKATG